MKIIYNSIIPFRGFKCINLFGVLFARKEYKIDTKTINHETIHTSQMKELLYIFFYIIYFFEWLIRVIFSKDRFSHKAYRNISFEKEAFENEFNMNYVKNRKHYAQWRNRGNSTKS